MLRQMLYLKPLAPVQDLSYSIARTRPRKCQLKSSMWWMHLSKPPLLEVPSMSWKFGEQTFLRISNNHGRQRSENCRIETGIQI